MSAGDKVNVREGVIPEDYHCRCSFCTEAIGELRPPDGAYYSRLERRGYYDPKETGRKGHIAKTPLHIARWAVQRYTEPGDWVLDPTAGAGTTMVEALTQDRNAAGMELGFEEIIKANVSKHAQGRKAVLWMGDARTIGEKLADWEDNHPQFSLVVNNPPYSGDRSTDPADRDAYRYEEGAPNLAFLNEGEAYWEALAGIYRAATEHLKPGGHFVIGVKDMMRHRDYFMLHEKLCRLVLERVPGMWFVGTAFLKHYPMTLFLNTYERRYGIKPPLYQTISVFKKES